MLVLNSLCICVQACSGCFFLVGVRLWSACLPCVDEQRISAFEIAMVRLPASLYTVQEKRRLPSLWPHYQGRRENQVIALGKWRRSILKSGIGNTQKGTDAREEGNKNVAYCEDEQGDKTSEDTQRWRHTGGKAVIPSSASQISDN